MRLADVPGVRRDRMPELVRYLLVSGSGVAVNVATFAFLRLWAIPSVVCGALAFAAACQHNVTWHARVTFAGAGRGARDFGPGARRSARFFGLSLVTLGVSLAVLTGVHRAGVGAVGAQGVSILAACPLNFLGSRHWVFVDGADGRGRLRGRGRLAAALTALPRWLCCGLQR